MSDLATLLLLLSVPGLPLLLAIPALRRHLPWSVHIALLPATILLFVPGSLSIDLPWALQGSTGLGIDTVSRWWLAMSVVSWAVVGILLPRLDGRTAGNSLTTLFLMTLAGQLGAILATGMVGFFAFTTLMGYAFCGLLFVEGDEQASRAGRIYLVLMILADIALFEALLITATLTDDLGFAALAQAMPLSMSSALYLSIVMVGFALKTGFWPLHVWLPLAYGSARPAVALLLWVVPIATGILGVMRWLPLGEITAPIMGTLLQTMGAAAVLYEVLFGLVWARRNMLSASVAIIAMGVFVMGLGAGMVDPAAWNQYRDLVPVFVVAVGLGLGLEILVSGSVWLEKRSFFSTGSGKVDGAAPWFVRWSESIIRWGLRIGIDYLPGLYTSLLARLGGLWQSHTWQRACDAGEYYLQRWTLAITLFLLLGMVVVVLLLLGTISSGTR